MSQGTGRALRLALLAGGAALIGLIAYSRIGSALDLLRGAGTVLLWLVPLHAVPLALDAAGWQALLPRGVRLRTLLWIAAVREAVNRLLPVGNVGGDIIGIGLLARSVPAATVTASVLIETLLTMIAQLLFAILGAACLFQATGNVPIVERLSVVLIGAMGLILALWAALRSRAFFARLWHFAVRFFRDTLPTTLLERCVDIDGAIERSRGAASRWALAVSWQLSGLVCGATETWLALRWLGHPVGIGPAIALESITQAVRSLLFLIPSGLGVQELSLIGIGRVFGVPSEVALALSLAKRMRELVFGLPVLGAWYALEGRGLWRPGGKLRPNNRGSEAHLRR